MPLLSVIIPFFQRESGVLKQTLLSIASQDIPSGWTVDVIVVDDSSPIPAASEIDDIKFPSEIGVRVIQQPNAGPAAARNRGLDAASKECELIAFLDSDDTWQKHHISRVISAAASGYNFYFTDNHRQGHHHSHVYTGCAPETGAFLQQSGQKSGLLQIPSNQLIRLVLKEFPTQASTVAFKAQIARNLRFDSRFKSAGEDVFFMAELIMLAERCAFDFDNFVECGSGINMYFNNLGWDSQKFLSIKVDQYLCHRWIGKKLQLSPESKAFNDEHTMKCRSNLAFHMLREFIKRPSHATREFRRFFSLCPSAAARLPFDMVVEAIRKAITKDSKETSAIGG